MPDLKSKLNPLFLREQELRQGMELLFYAYRDFTAEPDKMLSRFGFGRAHHRVVYFVGRYPRMTVSELLRTLRITKQSLSRVLGSLVEEGFVLQQADPEDRRRRLLSLTDKGMKLEHALSEVQMRRFAQAYREAGIEAVEGFRRVMRGMVDAEDRARVDKQADRSRLGLKGESPASESSGDA